MQFANELTFYDPFADFYILIQSEFVKEISISNESKIEEEEKVEEQEESEEKMNKKN